MTFVVLSAIIAVSNVATVDASMSPGPMDYCSNSHENLPSVAIDVALENDVTKVGVPLVLSVKLTVLGDDVNLLYEDSEVYLLELRNLETKRVDYGGGAGSITHLRDQHESMGFVESRSFDLRKFFVLVPGFYQIQVQRVIKNGSFACSAPLLFRISP